MRTYSLQFPNTEGVMLSARLDLPIDGRPAAYALFSHCFTGNKNLNAVRHICRALTQADIGVLRFDFTGLGQSQGDFANTTFSSNVADLWAAANFMEAKGMAPQLLIGHSLGGAAAVMAAPKIPSIKAIVTLCSPSSPAHVQHHFEHHIDEIQERGEAQVILGGRKFRIKKQFIADLERQDLGEILRNMGKALLVMHAPQDETVAIEHAAKLYQAAKHPKSFVTLDGADHLLTQEADALYAGQVISSWASRYIARDEDVLVESEKHVATQTDAQCFTDINAGQFRLMSDERKEFGGNGFAPTPYDMLLGALGSSIGIALQAHAQTQGWALEWVRVHIDQHRFHGEDRQQGRTLEQAEVMLEWKGALTPEQQEELRPLAQNSPIFLLLSKSMMLHLNIMNIES
jgi:putative redox protein